MSVYVRVFSFGAPRPAVGQQWRPAVSPADRNAHDTHNSTLMWHVDQESEADPVVAIWDQAQIQRIAELELAACIYAYL